MKNIVFSICLLKTPKKILILVSLQIIVIIWLIIFISEKHSNRIKIINNGLNIQSETVPSNQSNLFYFYEPGHDFIDSHTDQLKGVDIDLKIFFNKDTLNEPVDYSLNKPDDVFRIITLGDSSTFGVYVSTLKNYSEQLEYLLNKEKTCSKYSKIEVINLGVPGYDQEYALERFIRRGKKYKPDLVIWHLVSIEKHNETFIPFLKSNPKATSEDIEKFLKKTDEETMLERQKKPILDFLNEFDNKTIFLTESYDSLKINDEFNDFIDGLTNTNSNVKKLRNIFVLGNTKNKVIFENDGHPNNKGHFLIANHLANYLKNNKLICSQ